MTIIYLEKYKKEVIEKFGDKINRTEENNNEIHFILRNINDIPLICDYVCNSLGTRLTTIICTDERKIRNGFVIRYVFGKENREDVFIFVTALVNQDKLSFPSIALQIPAAFLYEREIKDMFGLIPVGNPDTRPLALHNWPENTFPLRKEFDLNTKETRQEKQYSFLKVEGEGICEIPVGPIHAGIIEPGHFRFSILGENIINLETRLGYTHKGIEKLAESMKLEDALLLSERIAGDESVANSTAYCQAIEKIARTKIPKRAENIRTIFGELERLYNHIGTLAGISTDAGFPFGAARLNILKERLMQLNESSSGSRLLFGVNRIGGVRCDISDENRKVIINTLDMVSRDFEKIITFLKAKSSLMDRLKDTGKIQRKIAQELGVVGVIARSSGIDIDTRRDHPYASYFSHNHRTPQQLAEEQIEMEKRSGDVLARFELRVKEVRNSMTIIEESLNLASDGMFTNPPELIMPYGSALGYSESHRGQTIHWIMMGENNSIFRYKIRTASFCNWPMIEHAILNDIVPDFPLVNKSLDLSYTGNDL